MWNLEQPVLISTLFLNVIPRNSSQIIVIYK